MRIKFNFDSVPAIRGDDAEIVDRLLKLKNAKVVSARYVREELGISEDAAPTDDSEPADGSDGNPDGEGDDRQKEAANTLYGLFKLQRKEVLAALGKMTANGSIMLALVDPDGQSKRAFPEYDFARRVKDGLLPMLKESVDAMGVKALSGSPVTFDPRQHVGEMNALLRIAAIDVDALAKQIGQSLNGVVADADRFGTGFRQMEKRVRGLFSAKRADEFAAALTRGHALRTRQWVKTVVRNLHYIQ